MLKKIKKVVSIVIAVCLFLSTNDTITAFAQGGDLYSNTFTTAVTLEFEDPDEFRIINETTLLAAINDESYGNVYKIWNSFPLESGVPLSLNTGDYIFESATGEPITLYQTVAGVRHFNFTDTGNVNITFNNVTLDGNDIGGGIYVRGSSNIVFTGAMITKCLSNNVYGGGVYVRNGSTFTATNCNIDGNTVNGGYQGAGIYIEYYGTVIINGGSISNNTANIAAGGGVYNDGGTLTINNASIIGNKADSFGGGIVTMGSSYVSGNLTLNGATISNNTALTDGGGIYYSTFVNFNITDDVYFSGNTSDKAYRIENETDSNHLYNGRPADQWRNLYDTSYKNRVKSLSVPFSGASFNYAFNNMDINYVGTLESLVTDENFKIIDEPTLRQAMADVTFGNVYPIWNDINLVSGEPLFIREEAKNSGFTFMSATGTPITIYQTVAGKRHFYFGSNQNGITMTFQDVTLDGRGIGGGIEVRGSYSAELGMFYGDVTLTNVVLQNCRATNGGAIAFTGDYMLTLRNPIIKDNTADLGGAIHSGVGRGNIYVYDGDISNNEAGQGGALHSRGFSAFCDSNITDNKASDGGGFFIYQGNLELNDCEVDNNEAIAGNGGGIFLNNQSLLSLENVVISNNSALNGGGIYYESSNTPLNDRIDFKGNVTFSGNTADTAYWIERDDTHKFHQDSATTLKGVYDTHLSHRVVSLSSSPQGTRSFDYMNNNYDVGYIGTELSAISPAVAKLIFHNDTDIANLLYRSAVPDTDVLAGVIGTKPTMKILDTEGVNWSLKASYTTFMVDGIEDPRLLFARRTAGNTYANFAPNTPTTVFSATDAVISGEVVDVPWGEEDLLKIYVPAGSHDLAGKPVSTVITWSFEVTP